MEQQMPSRTRARDEETGQFLADDPSTTEINEAFAMPTFDPYGFLGIARDSVPVDSCSKAIELARQAAVRAYKIQLPSAPEGLPKGPTEAIRTLALHLLTSGQLGEVPPASKLPRLVRYHFMRPFNA